MRTGQTTLIAGIIGALFVSHGATAATQDIIDPASAFTLSYDDSQSGLAEWGVPSLANNVISFPQLSFDAGTSTTPDGSGVGATMRLTLTAKNPNIPIARLDWLENGVYGVASSDASAINWISASVGLQLYQTGSDVALGAPVSMEFDQHTLQTQTVDAPWSLSPSLIGFGALPQVDIEITNQLLSSALFGPEVSFSKTDAALSVSLVPLPPAAILFAGALAAVVGFSRRRLAGEHRVQPG